MTVQPPITPPAVVSTPQPTATQLVYEAIQDGLLIVGALGITVPTMLQSSQVQLQIAAGVAGLIGIGMSIVDRWRTSHAAHASAVLSAQLGRPVR